MQQNFTAENTNPGIIKLIRDAVNFLRENGASTRSLFIGELVLEEILTNTVKYGYDDKLQHIIKVTADVSDGRITIEFRDDGHPFDPLQAPPPKFGEPIQTQRLGGRGIHMVRTMVRESHYRRENDQNILTLGFPVKHT